MKSNISNHDRSRAALTLGCLLLLGSIAHAGTVGDPQHPDLLAASLADAYSHGDRDITIAPGTYDLPSAGKDTIAFDRWTDTKVHARRVTLIFQDLTWAHRPVHFNRCKNVAFDGAILRLAVPAATQGRVVALDSDATGKFCDYQVDTGYKSDIDPVKCTFDVVDQHSRVLKPGTGDFSPQSAEPLGPGRFRLRFRGDLPAFAVGDWLITRAGGGSVLCHVDESENVTLKDLTLENGGFATLFETGGGGNHYIHCRVTFGPKPAGATENEIVSCGADGFHSTGTSRGPDIDGCRFEGVFHDDCIAIHGSFHDVVSSQDNKVVLKNGVNDFAPGHPVRISSGKGFFAQANCTAVEDLGGPDHHVQLTLDAPLAVPAGSKANNPDRCGRGYRIVNCYLGNTRSRGILVKADDGLIDHCVIDGCGMSGVSIGPEYWWGEANYCWNVTVSDNTFKNCDKNNDWQAAVLVHGDGAIGNRNIVIKGNRFDGDYGQYVMNIQWTDGVHITGNTITGSHQLPLKNPGHVIELVHAHNVKLSGNIVSKPGPSLGSLVETGDDTIGVVNNDDAGIRRK